MPNYYRPDTYFEESLRPISDLAADPAEAGAAFVGKARGGPRGPVQVTSWSQYQALFGGVSFETNDMSYAVFNFFANGGRGAHIVRAYASDATAASLMVYDASGVLASDEVFRVNAQAPGTWASDTASASRVFVTTRVTTAVSSPAIAAPTGLTAAAVGTGGTFAAATYFWKITAINANGETLASNEASVAVVLNGSATLNWTAVSGATGYRVYRATTTNGQSTSPAFVAAVGAATTYTDTGTAVSAGAVPATNTTATTTTRFDLIVDVGSSTYLAATETWTDLSMDPADARYALDIVNSPTVGSKYVTLVRSANIVGNAAPGVLTKVPLTGGSEGTAAVDVAAAAQLLGQVNKTLVINLPAASLADVNNVVAWAETTGKHFVVADVPKPASSETDVQSVTAMTTFSSGLTASSLVAVYGPWYYAPDPGSTAGAMRLTAPGGAVVAQILRTDATRGVHKAPAGVATIISGALQPYQLYTNAQQDSLAQSSVNLIKPVPGSGVVVWGARTKAIGTSDRYVPVRRLLIALKASLTNLTRFAAFENNDDSLRLTVEETVRRYLQTQYDLGALKGRTPTQAFFVRCDESNNPPAVEESGTLVIEVGVALKTPAEFILIRIGQQEAGTSVADSLEEI